MNNELAIYDDKGTLDDVGLRFNRTDAKLLADGWNARSGIQAKIHHRRIKVDGVSFPVFMVISRRKEKK